MAKGSLTGEGIRGELDRAGISQGVLFAAGVLQPRCGSGKVLVPGQLRVERWGKDKETELQRLETALVHPKVVGIKLARAHQHYRMDDPSYDDIYALRVSIYLHTGPIPFPGTSQDPAGTNPTYLEPAIAAFPGTPFILGHLGHDFVNGEDGALQACIGLAQTYQISFSSRLLWAPRARIRTGPAF